MRGRPLIFLSLVVSGWAFGRVMLLSPDIAVESARQVAEDMLVPSAAAETPTVRAIPPVVARASLVGRPRPVVTLSRPFGGDARDARPRPGSSSIAQVVVAGLGPVARPLVEPAIVPGLPSLPSPAFVRPAASRWSGSTWVIARDGSGASLLSPLLGGAQAGVRIAYRLDDRGRTALFARAAAPLRNGRAELAAGIQARPTAAPVTVFAEVRAVRGNAAPALGVFGGGATTLPADFRLEGYGQAGVIRRDDVSGFGDGQLRLVRPLGRIEIGAGVWGAAQRGASRMDIGPSLALPLATPPLTLRVALDWRHRVAGNARPASGPAVSLGADF